MKKVVIILILCALSASAGAQGGYLGSRVEAYVNAQICPAWFSVNTSLKKGLTRFDTWYSPGVNLIIDEHAVLGLEYHFASSMYVSDYGLTEWEYEREVLAYSPISVYGIGIHYLYYADLHAPLGAYAKVQFDHLWYKAGYPALVGITEPSFRSSMNGLAIGWGYSSIFFDRLILSPEMQLGMSIGQGSMTNDDFELSETNGPTLADRKVRHLGYVRLGLRIGLLAF